MIVPVTAEAEWLKMLESVPPWQPPQQHTFVIAPHPDDETLAAGGLIASLRQSGVEVSVIAVTDGENCYAGEDLRPVRPGEQAAALAWLGVDEAHIHRLHLPDSDLAACEPALTDLLFALIPDGVHLVAPWPRDFHPDHEVCGRCAQLLSGERHLTLSYYFFWTWHRGTPDLLRKLSLHRFELTGEQRLAKREALLCHASQLYHRSGEPILPMNLLEPAWRTFEVFLPA